MSPDNVLLPDRRLDRARIIDFGIAKDLRSDQGDDRRRRVRRQAGLTSRPSNSATSAARSVPGLDIYSLGLVIMAVATGKDVDMGTTLVEAVDKRRQGIDLSPLPEDIRPILERMLQADPAKRARSMDEVLGMLDEQGRTTFRPTTSIPPTTTTSKPIPATPSVPPELGAHHRVPSRADPPRLRRRLTRPSPRRRPLRRSRPSRPRRP